MAGEEVKAIPFDAPVFYVSTSQVFLAGNDFTLILGRSRPVQVEAAGPNTVAVKGEAVAVIQCSPGTAKDVLLALQDQIGKYEQKFGKIETEFTRTLAAQKK